MDLLCNIFAAFFHTFFLNKISLLVHRSSHTKKIRHSIKAFSFFGVCVWFFPSIQPRVFVDTFTFVNWNWMRKQHENGTNKLKTAATNKEKKNAWKTSGKFIIFYINLIPETICTSFKIQQNKNDKKYGDHLFPSPRRSNLIRNSF